MPEKASRMSLLKSRHDPLAPRRPWVPPVVPSSFWIVIRSISPAAMVTIAK